MASRPPFVELNQIGNSCDSREGQRPRLIVLHTQEGDGSAQSLADYLNNPGNSASYHYTIDNRGTVIDVVDTDEASWSVLSANPFTINLCFAGSYAHWTRQQWLDNMGRAIDIAAYLTVQDCRKYGIPARLVPYEQLWNTDGITDHRGITRGLGIGDHQDVGDGFPWDVFEAAVNKYANPASTIVAAKVRTKRRGAR